MLYKKYELRLNRCANFKMEFTKIQPEHGNETNKTYFKRAMNVCNLNIIPYLIKDLFVLLVFVYSASITSWELLSA